ncbi:STAS/SEC14 domain-containing protein [Cyanobacterium sp. Dongsha4]|uniref:STAS/SEC14 domain-containing protein n=1 Tax=Cyanobacterium sp. DS4 TaxID=2878255 RepID=UPI002E809F2A|nr:STAS/SEC14 domain-containing protein [Cyanobacterium sp. Dongsha4]WVL00047.1 STAS/SEC14 domain-containing protein [Cyanobacterium sp. Dongsha4]
MPKIKLEAQLSKEDLLQAVEQLTNTEMEEFMLNIIAFRAKKLTNHLSNKETELLLNINEVLSKDIQDKYQLLITKRQKEELNNNEYEELLTLTELIENHQNQRLKYLVELSNLRGCSLEKLMDELEIKPTDNE